jgi:4-amino-4-deoxy-L-arabinose transferase-like glycosyltransferase
MSPEGGAVGRTFDAAARRPVLVLVVLLAIQTLPGLWSRDLSYYDEVRHGNVLQHVVEDGHWLVLRLNGEVYPDKPPVYFWILAAFAGLFRTDAAWIFLLAAALSALAYVVVVHRLARRVGGEDPRGALASALVVLGSLWFAAMARFSRMDLLFSAIVVASQVCLFRAFVEPAPNRWPVVGFLLAGLATLVKGPLGLAFPLVSSVAFLAWRGRLGRLLARDVLLGFVAALALLAAWAGAVVAVEGSDYFRALLQGEVVRRAVDPSIHAQPPWFYVPWLPLQWLPWTLVLLGVPWRGLFSRAAWRERFASRRTAPEGPAYLWAMAISGFALISTVGTKIPVYVVPLLAPMGVLTVRALARMETPALKRVWAGAAGFSPRRSGSRRRRGSSSSRAREVPSRRCSRGPWGSRSSRRGSRSWSSGRPTRT